jgi:uncharacterized protein YgiM (DUF1202 family)
MTLTCLVLLLMLHGPGLSFWTKGLAYAETTDDYVVQVRTILNGDKVQMEASVWDPRLGQVNSVSVEGRPDRIEAIACPPPSGKPLSRTDVALCDAVRQMKEWFARNLWPARVQVTATSANIRETPSIQSAIIATVPRGTVLRKVGEQEIWLKVLLESGALGWISRELVE